MFCTTLMAVPALKQWRTVSMTDGTLATVMMIGDEWGHYYITDDGKYVEELKDGTFRYIDNATAKSKQMKANKARRTANARRLSRRKANRASTNTDIAPNYMSYRGTKRGVVILAEFPDKSFYSTSQESAVEYYNAMLNKKGYNVNGAPGSVHDYFSDMSGSLFSLEFDIYGPVTVTKSSTDYGGTVYGGDEGVVHAGEFISEAITLADKQYDINWANYDWDNNKEVDQVFVLYAGYGRATEGLLGTLWPHESSLTDMKHDFNSGTGALTLKGMKIDVYGCSNELKGNFGTQKMGLGTFCHEFSHCLGLPDTYSMSKDKDMGSWDLMASGNYNKNYGWCPAPWTPWERHYAGWLEYTELKENDSIKALKPLLDEAKAYVIYNENNRNEYYTLHNSGKNSWDEYLKSNGLLITHVDYDETIFNENYVNTLTTALDPVDNDHCRMLLIGSSRGDYTYPLRATSMIVNSLTDTTMPAAKLYNENTDGTLLMHRPVYDIVLDPLTGYISFNFMPKENTNTTEIETVDYSVNSDRTEVIYNLNGQRLNTLQKGINIIGGKKILVK